MQTFARPILAESELKGTSFTVSWSGHDDTGGSGVAYYDVYFTDNGGECKLFAGHTTATSSTFSGLRGHTSAFYSVATDNVGNTEAAPASPEAHTIVLLQTTAAVVAAPNPVFLGSKITLTATVSVVGGSSPATGSVTFKDGTKILGTGTLSTTGGVTTSSFSTTKLTAGKHTITAVYGGDASDATSTSSPLNVIVDRFASTTKLVVSASQPSTGSPVTFTATIAIVSPGAGTPTGSVTFKEGTKVLATKNVSTTNGVTTAAFSTSSLAAGKHTILAIYSGSAQGNSSTSKGVTITVGPSKMKAHAAVRIARPLPGGPLGLA